MSDEGERTCPLCAEEMDLTDQQLKPCRCGYGICVWCWHHIIDMAVKEGMEGRCPACRTPYDKERIVGMASDRGRTVSEINADKKQKSQKAQPKTSTEARKHLSSVRVIQKNLVYIIGLPHNLCDESLLEHKEYFGQYGKILKLSISHAIAASQQASNNCTFSMAKISAPPGFSVPSKVHPPGLSSQDRNDQAHKTTYSENHLLGSSYGSQYQMHLTANTGDVEFIDPAILAVGKGQMPLAVNNLSLGLRSSFPVQFRMPENDSRFQLLMQQPISSPTNIPISDCTGSRFLPFNDPFLTAQLLSQNHSGHSPFAQLQQPTNSCILTSQWDGWSLQNGNGVGMAEILRNERIRPNTYFPSNEEHKFQIPSSGDLYNRMFGL